MTRSDRLAARRAVRWSSRRSWLALILATLTLGTGGTIAWAAISAQPNAYACFGDTDGLQKSNLQEFTPSCPSGQHVDSFANGQAGTIVPTTAPTTTTTKPVTTTTQPSGNAKPPAGGYFSVQPAGFQPRSETTCAAAVHRSTWEPRPDNFTANHHVPADPTLGNFSQWNSAWNTNYRPTIRGDFTGTTDELFQFYACKWGWADDLLRAEAISESNWHQSQVGDNSTSYGIMQVRYLYHPRVQNGCKACAGSSWPNSEQSTAFNLDIFGAEMRGCLNGMSTYLGNTSGDVWGCIQSWYSGSWYPGGGNQWYSNEVKGYYNGKPWLGWSG